MAHELGHSLGLMHRDNDDDCIMNNPFSNINYFVSTHSEGELDALS